MENYLGYIKNNKHKKALARFRLSCHPLMIEKGRHHKPPLDRSLRTCPICEMGIENEIHFITECPLYVMGRVNLYAECLHTSKHFQSQSTIERFIFIMSNENPRILEELARFVYMSLKLRDQVLSQTDTT